MGQHMYLGAQDTLGWLDSVSCSVGPGCDVAMAPLLPTAEECQAIPCSGSTAALGCCQENLLHAQSSPGHSVALS